MFSCFNVFNVDFMTYSFCLEMICLFLYYLVLFFRDDVRAKVEDIIEEHNLDELVANAAAKAEGAAERARGKTLRYQNLT